MIKRIFDIICSLLGLVLLAPLFMVVALLIIVSSKGEVFYIQNRVGKGCKDFKLFKFRTMAINSDKKGLITVGKDNRITKIGYYLRKYKVDELPQLLNVLLGSMSIVGPRPEVRKYVDMYSKEQLKVLTVKPGITDYASLEYFNESELLGKSNNPEETYIKRVIPEKLALSKKYIDKHNLFIDLQIIFRTIVRILS